MACLGKNHGIETKTHQKIKDLDAVVNMVYGGPQFLKEIILPAFGVGLGVETGKQ